MGLTAGQMQTIRITPLDIFGQAVSSLTHSTVTSNHSIKALIKATDPDRGTGRTSKMLWEAAMAKDEGEDVMIVVHDENMIHFCLGTSMNGAWWGLEYVDFVTIERASERARGRHLRNCYVDHFVLEQAGKSHLIAKCYHDLEDVIFGHLKSYQYQTFSQTPSPAMIAALGNP